MHNKIKHCFFRAFFCIEANLQFAQNKASIQWDLLGKPCFFN